MQIVRIIILVLIIVYHLLALVFVHISLSYRKQLGRSSESLYSLFAGQIALFKMLADEFDFKFTTEKVLNEDLEAKNFQSVNKLLSDTKLAADAFVKSAKVTDAKFTQLTNGLEENVTLIRNEVYRYNKLVENLNVNKDSLIFALFVVMLRLKTLNKI